METKKENSVSGYGYRFSMLLGKPNEPDYCKKMPVTGQFGIVHRNSRLFYFLESGGNHVNETV